MQINPHYPEWWLITVGQVYFDARRYEETVAALEGVQKLNAIANCLYVAASHAALGNLERARAAIARACVIDAHLTIANITRGFLDTYKEKADREHLRDNLLKAGMPE
jgi:adenylate cyclase